MRLKPMGEQVVVLLGASSGIGRATALRFARRGAKVVVSARSAEALEGLAQEIRSAGGDALALPAEATDPAGTAVVMPSLRSASVGPDTTCSRMSASVASSETLRSTLTRRSSVTR